METKEKVRVLAPSTITKTTVSPKGNTTLSFNLRTGRIGFSINLVRILKELKLNDGEDVLVQFLQDPETPKDWHLKVVTEDGFPVGVYGKNKSYQLTNMAVVVEVTKSLSLLDAELFFCNVSQARNTDVESPFHGSLAIITSSAKVKNSGDGTKASK